MWKLVADMTPEQFVACIDFRYLTDALTRDEALEILRGKFATRGEREAQMRKEGYPAYITSAGWMGYPDDKVRRLCREALAAGWTRFKIKVGRDSDANVHRAAIVREEIGPRATHDDGCEPGVGRRRGDRVDAPARALQSAVDRRADQSRRCPRSRHDSPRD